MAEDSTGGIPSLDQFLADAKPLNPDASNAQLIQAYQDHFGVTAQPAKPSATLPTFDEFKKDAKPLNPGATTSELHQAWEDNFQVLGAREKKPTFAEAFKEGAKQGYLGLQEAARGVQERSLDPNDPLKQFSRDAGNALAEEAQKHGVPEDLQSKPFWDRIRDPEYLGNFLGNILVQSAPSAAGAVAGGVVGGPVGAMAGMAGVTFFQQAGQSYREAYQKYKNAGFSDQKAHENAYQASGIAGAVSSAVNSLAVPASLMSPAKSMLKNLIMRYAANVAVDTGDQVTGNLVAKGTYEPGRDVTSGVPEAAVGSALLGAPETMGAVKLGVMPNRVGTQPGTKPPDQGIKPNLTPPSTPPDNGSGLRPNPLPAVGGAPTAQAEINRVDPILKATNVDDVIKEAGKVNDEIPIDVNELDRVIGEETAPEIEKATREAQETTKQAQRDIDQKALDDLAVNKTVSSQQRQQDFQAQANLDKFKFDAVSPSDLPTAPVPAQVDSQGATRHVLTQPQYQALSDILQLDGTRLVLYQHGPTTKKNFDGFMDRNIPNTIFLNVKSVTDPSTIVFHELQHFMQRTDLFDAYRKTVMEELAPGAMTLAKKFHGQHLSNPRVFEEIMSDIHGDAMTRPAFHQKLIQNLEAQVGPEEAKPMLMQFVDTLRQKIARITQLITRRSWQDQGGKNVAERYVNNLERVHDALAQALAQHYRDQALKNQAKQHADAKAFVESIPPVVNTPLPNPVTGFQTAKGSTYQIGEKGVTTRNKAPRPERPGDEGPQATSEHTFYVDQKGLNALSEFQTTGEKKRIVPIGKNQYGVQYASGKFKDRVEARTVVQGEREPKVGLHPVELFKGGERVHFGNKIVNLITKRGQTKEETNVEQKPTKESTENQHDQKNTPNEPTPVQKDELQEHFGADAQEVKDVLKPRTSEDVQKDIDEFEGRLEKEGVNVSHLYDEADQQQSILKGYKDYKPMPEKLAKLYRERNDIDTRDKQQFYEAIVRESKLDRQEASKALGELYLTPDKLTSHFNDTLKRWNIDTTLNLGKLYNHFLYKKYKDGNMGEDYDDKRAKFAIGGTADKPTIAATTRDGRPLDQDVMDKVRAIWNAIARNIGSPEHDFRIDQNGTLKIQGNTSSNEHTAYMPGGPSVNQPSYTVSSPTGLDKFIRTLQDKHVDLKRLVEAIDKAGNKVPDQLNPVFREEMYHKRAQQRADDFTNQELKPLLDAMRSNNVGLKQLDDYMHARHVINDGLNAKLQAMNPDLAGTPEYEKLAGITDAEARAILNKANPKVMEPLAARVDAMIEKTRNMMVEYGLESQQRVDQWRDQYTSYVPLHREGFEDEGKPTGTGMSVRGSSVKDRLGSALKVVDVVANVAQARDQVISRGEKMRPVVALAGLFLKFPNKDIAKLDKYAPVTVTDPTTGLDETIPGDLADYKRPTIRRRDPKTGEVKAYPDPTYKGRENVVNFRIGGKDYALIFNEHNERAMEIAKGLKNLDTPQLNGIMKAVAPFTRYLASINTQYNPIFGIVNFVRDVQFAALSLKSTELAGKTGEMLSNVRQLTGGIYADAKAVRNGMTATSPAAQWWSRFEHVGGPTGYRDLFFTSTERAEAMNDLLNPKTWSQIRSAAQFARKMEGTWLFQTLSDYNLMMENSIRLAVFKTGIENGLSDIKAASLAKNVTVNFNRKGQIGAQMGSLYAFFNANVQGTARIMDTLFERDEVSKLGFRISSLGKRMILGGILLGALQAFGLAMAGFGDDEPPEYIKARNLVVPAPGTEKGYLSIPMPLGFNLLPSVGRLAAESVIAGLDGRSPKIMDKGANLMAAMMDTFNPLGSSGSLTQALAPTVADPAIALSENKDWTGKSIYQTDHSELRKTPGHTRSKDTATIWAVGLSKMINWASGGSDYVPGKLSPSPDAIDYLINQATGGVGREVGKIAQTVRSGISGEELPTYKMPLVGRFVGSVGGTTGLRDRFYDNIRNVNAYAMEIEGRMKHGEDFSEIIKEHPEAQMKSTALRFQKQLSELRRQKHELVTTGATKEDVQTKEKQITNLMQMFNDQVDRLQNKS